MFIDNLLAALPDIEIKQNWPLAPLCTLNVGGRAEVFAEPSSFDDARKLFSFAVNKGIKFYVLGGGSNVLFPDGLIKGIVISTRKLNAINWLNDFSAEVQAGFLLPILMKNLREKNLAGLEFAAGIPGTVGGALAGNAGAGGHGVCEFADELITAEADGKLKTWNNSDFYYDYRKCSLSDGKRIILSARMTFRPSQPEDKEIAKNFLLRRKSQPQGFHNAGCTFKNPDGKSAGKLLDECRCKNLSVGDAFVSDIHANFILNRGHASSSDVLELIKICRQRVFDSTGIKLEPEIKIMCPCECV